MLGPDDLILCAGTLPRGTPFRERVTVAAAAGFAAISLWGRDYRQAREDEGLSDGEMRAVLGDHGVVVAELDPAWWWTPGAAEVHIPPEADPVDVFRYGEDDLLRIAEAVGARSLNAADVFGGDWTVDDGAAAFAGLCDRFAEVGVLVHLEWLVWSKIPDLATAWQIVRLADRPNGGLNVDMWHCARAGTTADELRALPADRVLAVQVDDGSAEPEANLIEATLHDRRLPGEGDFDVIGYLRALRDVGVQAPIGVEVFSDELHALGAADAALQAAAATRRVLAAR